MFHSYATRRALLALLDAFSGLENEYALPEGDADSTPMEEAFRELCRTDALELFRAGLYPRRLPDALYDAVVREDPCRVALFRPAAVRFEDLVAAVCVERDTSRLAEHVRYYQHWLAEVDSPLLLARCLPHFRLLDDDVEFLQARHGLRLIDLCRLGGCGVLRETSFLLDAREISELLAEDAGQAGALYRHQYVAPNSLSANWRALGIPPVNEGLADSTDPVVAAEALEALCSRGDAEGLFLLLEHLAPRVAGGDYFTLRASRLIAGSAPPSVLGVLAGYVREYLPDRDWGALSNVLLGERRRLMEADLLDARTLSVACHYPDRYADDLEAIGRRVLAAERYDLFHVVAPALPDCFHTEEVYAATIEALAAAGQRADLSRFRFLTRALMLRGAALGHDVAEFLGPLSVEEVSSHPELLFRDAACLSLPGLFNRFPQLIADFVARLGFNFEIMARAIFARPLTYEAASRMILAYADYSALDAEDRLEEFRDHARRLDRCVWEHRHSFRTLRPPADGKRSSGSSSRPCTPKRSRASAMSVSGRSSVSSSDASISEATIADDSDADDENEDDDAFLPEPAKPRLCPTRRGLAAGLATHRPEDVEDLANRLFDLGNLAAHGLLYPDASVFGDALPTDGIVDGRYAFPAGFAAPRRAAMGALRPEGYVRFCRLAERYARRGRDAAHDNLLSFAGLLAAYVVSAAVTAATLGLLPSADEARLFLQMACMYLLSGAGTIDSVVPVPDAAVVEIRNYADAGGGPLARTAELALGASSIIINHPKFH
ncbi:E2L/O1L-like protein [Nile crocodilepox virus]|uniref:E2L/O1L-like protein n=1 Tax=Nile crocodilepox virus (isolate Crocodylus niloticus/Zimbabwe/Ume/2001) TaxID=1289473 RepID=Q070J6_CPRVZ|nr:E2L/O1L-like protein [Nile crocodilepox virus]ABJ08946.1 E2L/O1L-like protein [Nile crocodilepox virus]